MKKDQIVMDLADTYAARWINSPRRNTFLEELIYQGKKLYLKDLWVPSAEDYIKIGYTEEELQWAEANEFYIWQYFVENELLYSTEPKLLTRFINPGPFSRFNLELEYFKNISEFSRIFDPNYYRLGRVGRLKLNNRFQLNHYD